MWPSFSKCSFNLLLGNSMVNLHKIVTIKSQSSMGGVRRKDIGRSHGLVARCRRAAEGSQEIEESNMTFAKRVYYQSMCSYTFNLWQFFMCELR